MEHNIYGPVSLNKSKLKFDQIAKIIEKNMELNENEIIEQDETEWIERRKHDLILRKCRLNAQRLIKEYQTKIQQKNRQIELLVKEVKRQKFIIDTFSKNGTSSSQTTIENEKNGTVSDSEVMPIAYADNEIQHSLPKYAKENSSNSCSPTKQRIGYTKMSANCVNRRTEVVRKKPSLLSIQIQPYIKSNNPSLANSYSCDVCNKTMSSRRVLAVG